MLIKKLYATLVVLSAAVSVGGEEGERGDAARKLYLRASIRMRASSGDEVEEDEGRSETLPSLSLPSSTASSTRSQVSKRHCIWRDSRLLWTYPLCSSSLASLKHLFTTATSPSSRFASFTENLRPFPARSRSSRRILDTHTSAARPSSRTK